MICTDLADVQLLSFFKFRTFHNYSAVIGLIGIWWFAGAACSSPNCLWLCVLCHHIRTYWTVITLPNSDVLGYWYCNIFSMQSPFCSFGFTVFPLLHAEFKKRFVNVGLVNGVNHYGIWHKLMSCKVVLISKCCFVLPSPFTQR